MKKKILILMLGISLMGAGLSSAGDLVVTGRGGIGMTNPSGQLDVAVDSEYIRPLNIYKYLEGAGGPVFDFYKARGTAASPSAPLYGDVVGGFNMWAYDGAAFVRVGALRAYVESVAGANFATMYFFELSDETGRMSVPMVIRGASGNVGIGIKDPGTYKLYVNGAVYASSYDQPSDIRLKEDIKAIESPLDKIQNIQGVTFNWKTEENKDRKFPVGRDYGVIGQEVEKVLPEIVNEGPDGEKRVSYTKMIPVLIEAVKEQQRIIEKQQKEIERLRTKVERIDVNLASVHNK